MTNAGWFLSVLGVTNVVFLLLYRRLLRGLPGTTHIDDDAPRGCTTYALEAHSTPTFAYTLCVCPWRRVLRGGVELKRPQRQLPNATLNVQGR